ncbi:hypothetical protein [Streptomyces sp. CB00455]|uniref:hypothetical protein n=1 Tax=Streptomyces sp. CB00455 TaxID=1703927 RepID=UPI0013012610
MTAMPAGTTTAALVTAVEEYRAESGAGPLARGREQVLSERWCGRAAHGNGGVKD